MLRQVYIDCKDKSETHKYFHGCCFGGFCGMSKFLFYVFGSMFASFPATMDVLTSHLYMTNQKWFDWKLKVTIESDTITWIQHLPEITAQITYFYTHFDLINIYLFMAFISTTAVIVIQICKQKIKPRPEFKSYACVYIVSYVCVCV